MGLVKSVLEQGTVENNNIVQAARRITHYCSVHLIIWLKPMRVNSMIIFPRV